MNILYVAPDIPVPHTGKFVGGSPHVMKIAESLAKRGKQSFDSFKKNERAEEI